jgi:hypothetical protein
MSNTDKVLNKPTVQQVIDLLATYPPDAKFILEDADTNWTIRTVHVREGDGEVCFYGAYSEMERT